MDFDFALDFLSLMIVSGNISETEPSVVLFCILGAFLSSRSAKSSLKLASPALSSRARPSNLIWLIYSRFRSLGKVDVEDLLEISFHSLCLYPGCSSSSRSAKSFWKLTCLVEHASQVSFDYLARCAGLMLSISTWELSSTFRAVIFPGLKLQLFCSVS